MGSSLVYVVSTLLWGAPDILWMDFRYLSDIYTDQSAPESNIYTQRSKTDSEVSACLNAQITQFDHKSQETDKT